MNELYINGQLCELSDLTKIAVTKQANNIGELQNRQGNFTNTFKLPLTQTNIAITGISTDVQGNSDTPYKLLNVTYKQDGCDIVANGLGYIDSVDEFINVSVTSGNANLSDVIGDLAVGDLYQGEVIDWDLSSVVNGASNWCFPLIDWRSDDNSFFDSDTVDPKFMLPCLKVSDIFSRLSTRIGFQFQGSYFNSSEYQSMYLTPSDFERLRVLEENKATFDNDGFAQQLIFTVTNVGIFVAPETNTFTSAEFTQSTNPQFIPSVNKVGNLRCRALVQTLRTSVFTPNSNRDIYFKCFIVNHTDSIVLTYYQTPTVTSMVNGDILNFLIDFQTSEMTFDSTKSYRCYFVAYPSTFTPSSDTLFVFIRNFEYSFNQSRKILYDSQIPIEDVFRTKVKDLFKDQLNFRCLNIQTDDYSNIVSVDFFNEIMSNEAIDWTDKIHDKIKPISFTFGKYARKNWFRFKENTNVPNEIGDAFFEVENENLSPETDVVKFSVPATEQSVKFSGVNIPKIRALNSNTEWQKPEARILQVVKQDLDFDVTFDDGTSSTTTDEDINLSTFVAMPDLLPYYSAIRAILDKTKVIRIPFKLTSIDIQNVDFMRPIYLNGFGKFYLNRIENYKGDITFCELVRL
jgi:hypothetical protein